MDECISPIPSEINIWYPDDGVLVGAPGTIDTQLDTIRENLLQIGLKMNTAKCEVTFPRKRGSQKHRDALAHVHRVLSDLKMFFLVS